MLKCLQIQYNIAAHTKYIKIETCIRLKFCSDMLV